MAALAALNAPAGQALSGVAAARAQRQLSQKIEAVAWATQLAQRSTAEKASMLSEAGLGARAFLQPLPRGCTRFEPAAFVAELRVRLHVPEAGEDSWCPKCDAVLDRFGHYAAVRVAGGERTLRNNLV